MAERDPKQIDHADEEATFTGRTTPDGGYVGRGERRGSGWEQSSHTADDKNKNK